MKLVRALGPSLLVVAAGPLAAGWLQTAWEARPVSEPTLKVARMLGEEAGPGFQQPLGPRRFQFPADHTQHPDFRTEWWYFTGNLEDFGYELTLFRQALLSPLEALAPRTSAWAARHAYLGHFTVTDVKSRRFQHFEKLSRGALGLAGCDHRQVWLDDWRVEWQSARDFRLQAEQNGYAVQLQLHSQKPPVLHGEHGLSRKGAEPGQASYYYSLTRLQTRGTLQTPSGQRQVAGNSWMDREWSTRPMAPNLSGWDWFSLQLDDGCELMFYQLRDKLGRATEWSSGTFVDPRGRSRHLRASEIGLQVTRQWSSPHDGTLYPGGWKAEASGYRLAIEPRIPDQELIGSARYWEGAVHVSGLSPAGQPVSGRGYVELVGYEK